MSATKSSAVAGPRATAPGPSAAIALLQSSSLASLVQDELERLIVAGELAPGDRLVEMTLAAQLGVSRGPLREAFRMLEQAGLVRTEKNRGVFVRDVPLDEALEIYDLRAAMEQHVGRELAGRIAPAELKEVRSMVDAMERAVKDQDRHAYHLLNLRFHDRLVELAGNRKLTALYRNLTRELALFRRVNLDGVDALPLSAGEHRAIVKAIAAGDAEAAGRELRAHVLESKERTVAHHRARAGLPSPAPTGPAAPESPRRVAVRAS